MAPHCFKQFSNSWFMFTILNESENIYVCWFVEYNVFVASCSFLSAGFLIVLCLRALRPLRLVSLVPSMRRVVWDVMLGWKKFLLGAILLVFFIFMFASLGVQVRKEVGRGGEGKGGEGRGGEEGRRRIQSYARVLIAWS